ncbi:MAG: 4-hydroxy-3-methylbut-2-en-1-yl diphosphate synthase [Candidatus Moraniibacteriota bacterium]|nr:MAG: 4-hydroxy-3-methylbut-2-en-1-yl diphosphate synthase [Candidatus Moranbacteria bacterium]
MMDKNNDFKALKPRRKSRVVMVGDVAIGGEHPVVVQTMTNTDTLDIDATVTQIMKCVEAGSEIVRITTPTVKHVQALAEIKEKLKSEYDCVVPIVADIHFDKNAAFEALEYADKIRLNPGNLLDSRANDDKVLTDEEYQAEIDRIEEGLNEFIEKLKKTNKPIRIGANWGSLSGRILARYGNTPKGLAESVMEYLRVFKKADYHNIVVAIKASDPMVMIEANRILVSKMDAEDMDYPIHLGVTEAGSADDGRAKSTIGIGTLLMEGIGDTLRVSLTEPPEEEIPVCFTILQAVQRRITKAEFISCPSCGRTLFDIASVTEKIKERLGHLTGVRIAVMGCIVNGPGEMADADYGYVGGAPKKISLYRGKEVVERNIPEDEALDALIELIKSDGKWVDSK